MRSLHIDRASAFGARRTTGGLRLILGVYGHHKSGKTLFLENMIDALRVRGLRAAAVKHIGENFREDTSGDTGRLAKAGYDPVVGVAPGAMFVRVASYEDIGKAVELVNRVADVDVIFVEGFKRAPIPKIAIGDIEEQPGTIMRLRSVLSGEFDQVLDRVIRLVTEEKERKKGAPDSSGEAEQPAREVDWE